jgi:transcription factor MYB, plant
MSIISGVKHEGNFLNKDDPKVATLLQQADLLSSLAAKIKTENTSESMNEAWHVCKQQFIATMF